MILVRLTLFFALGIFLGRTFGTIAFIQLACFPFLALALLLPTKITARFPKFLPLLLLGLAVASMGAALFLLNQVQAGNSVIGLEGRTVEMELSAMDHSKTTPFGKKVMAKVEAVGKDKARFSGGILLYLKGAERNLRPGDRLHAVVEVKKLNSRYPTYLQYLRDKGVVVSGKVKVVHEVGPAQGWMAPLSRLRNSLNQSLRDLMPDQLISGLAAAMLLGDRSTLDADLKEDFSRAGLSHILAISGLHVGIIFGFFQYALGFLARGPRGVRFQTLLSLTLLLIYLVLTGCSPAVCRAVMMIAFYQVGRLFFVQTHSLSSLAAAGMVLLAFDPCMLFQVGFQLSFSAVGGILVFGPKLQTLAEKRFGKWGRDVLVQSAVVCIAAQIFTAPLIAWHFGQFPTYFLFANLLLLPLVAFSVNLGAIALFFCWIPGLNDALFGMLDFCLWVLTTVGHWFGKLPGAVVNRISLHDPGFCILIGLSISLLLLTNAKWVLFKLRRKRPQLRPSLSTVVEDPS